jgi:hypothetical protein
MPALVLDLLKYVFLAMLYIFVARAIRAAYLELRPARPTGGARSRPAPPKPQAKRARKVPGRVAVVEGDTHKGKTFPIGDELIIGRAEKCHIKLDDKYVSQVHARIFSRGESCMAEDMGSTNGTYVNRRRISAPVELQRGDQVKIGKTVLEMRK